MNTNTPDRSYILAAEPRDLSHAGTATSAAGRCPSARCTTRKLAIAVGVALVLSGRVLPVEAVPDHPIITEVFNNPSGLNDGPTGRNVTNAHQEFVELFLPSAATLDIALNVDDLQLTFYEIEGDSGNAQRGWVNQRFDLPAFDLDPSNGITPGALTRPSTGIVILGWVDYNALNPPTDLLGTPSTRVGLINGGITTSPPGTLFIAMNGAEFTGTTNFPVPVAESLIDVPNENANGVMRNGSNAYLLVNRADAGYVSLIDRTLVGASSADLPGGTVLGLSSLLDGIAGNDDNNFLESAQPYATPTGLSIDLEDVLPLGGVFSPWVTQIAEQSGGGYSRKYVDVLRTTEDGIVGNEDPALDAAIYHRVFRTGPFFPSPGAVVFSTDPPRLGLPETTRLDFQIIANTTGRPGLLCANVGGDFRIDVAVTPGASSNPALVTVASDAPALSIPGQTEGFPQIAVTVASNAPNAALITAPVSFSATNTSGGDPVVQDPTLNSTATVTVLNPTQGINELGMPIETTVFLAVQGFGADPVVLNEFVSSDLGSFVAANLGTVVGDTLGATPTLLNPATNLEDIAVMGPLRQSFPATELDFINTPGALGTDDLTTTVTTSAKVLSGSTAYVGSINVAGTAIKALELTIPETRTKGGTFSTSAPLFFAAADGGVNQSPRSGLNFVTTPRTFELALIDTNVTTTGIESGDGDDFGLIVEVGQVLTGASVVPGQFVFLSYSGGLEGEDVDTVDVPGVNATVALLLDLDNLSDVLGIESITRLFVVDADLGGTLNIVEAISLNVGSCAATSICGDGIVCPQTEVCDDGFTDACGTCNATCSGAGAGSTCGDGVVCPETEVCDDGFADACGTCDATCSGAGAGSTCSDGLLCPETEQCDDGNLTPGDGCSATCQVEPPCDAPTAVTLGSRYFSATPAPRTTPIALLVTGSSADSAVACFSQYVQGECDGGANAGLSCASDADCPGGLCKGTGLLGPTPVRLLPAAWGTVVVRGFEIQPASTYNVQADCGTVPGAALSAPTPVTLRVWGDVLGDGAPISFADISLVVRAFQGDFAAPLEATDLTGPGCVPQRVVNFVDISADVEAFKGADFNCAPPCP